MAEAGAPPILAAEGVSRSYRSLAHGVTGRVTTTRALDRVTFRLGAGEIVGVVGRSGAGKTTLAKVLLGLDAPDEGRVLWAGRPISTFGAAETRRMRRTVQAVFQDPHSSLDPRQTVGGILAEPLAVHRLAARGSRQTRCLELLGSVGLPPETAFLARLPGELSGGERQRVAIARALACGPQVLVLDEPVSALDVSVRGQVLNLLLDLHRGAGLAMIVIAHDVRLVARLCRRVVVVSEGRVVEEGDAGRVLSAPAHRVTHELLAASRWLEGAGGTGTRREPPPGT